MPKPLLLVLKYYIVENDLNFQAGKSSDELNDIEKASPEQPSFCISPASLQTQKPTKSSKSSR